MLGPVRVHDASSPTIKSLVRSLYSAQDTLLQAEECHNPAPNYRSRSWKRTGEDGLAPVINDRIDGLRQSSFESGVVSSKRPKAKKGVRNRRTEIVRISYKSFS